MWKHLPWIIGVAIAPLLYAALYPLGQAICALLFASSFFLLLRSRRPDPILPTSICWLLGLLLLVPLVPLPPALVEMISPERMQLYRALSNADSHQWVPLTVSQSDTINRLWELSLALAAFLLARNGILQRGVPRALVLVLGFSALALAGTHVWLIADGKGVWDDPIHSAAGTFPNRNHFAGWLFVACLFCLGWLVRVQRPLIGSRSVPAPSGHLWRTDRIILLIAIPFSFAIAVLAGSRGALIAFGLGAAIWIALLVYRSHDRQRWRPVLIWGSLLFLAGIMASGKLLSRIASGENPMPLKLALWSDSFQIASKFPWMGTGWGTFATIFSQYKSGFPNQSVWHAENDLVQLFVEGGIVAAMIICVPAFLILKAVLRLVLRSKMAEPELCFGAVAGLAAIFLHGMLDFPFQIPANMILAAALLGVLVGSMSSTEEGVVSHRTGIRRRYLLFAGALLVAGLLQLRGEFLWKQAVRAGDPKVRAGLARTSLRFWPWNGQRQIGWIRSVSDVLSHNRAMASEEMIQTLRAWVGMDPMNWRLRLEYALFLHRYSSDKRLADQEISRVLKLNPLEERVRFVLAAELQKTHPERALALLAPIGHEHPEKIDRVLDLAWAIDPDPSRLWTFIPPNDTGFTALGEFAFKRRLYPLAVRAFARISEGQQAFEAAQRLLAEAQPELARELLMGYAPTRDRNLLLARAEFQSGNFVAAITYAQLAWIEDQSPRHESEVLAPNTSTPDMLERQLAAEQAARLRELLRHSPEDGNLRRQLMEAELRSGNVRAAAEQALILAERDGVPVFAR